MSGHALRPASGTVRSILRAGRKQLRKLSLFRQPLPAGGVREGLAAFGRPQNKLVMIHSSLSACGYIFGGEGAVVRLLREWCSGSTLVMPTHTYCYPDSQGNVVAFDPSATPSVVGIVTDCFWRERGSLRSRHPTHSLAAQGPLAEALIAGHENCETPCGPGSPYERLVEWSAGVLMFGATLNSYTLFHTAEDAADVSYLYEPRRYELKSVKPSGAIQSVKTKRHDMSVERRFAKIDGWLEGQGLLHRRLLGRGELLWIPDAAAAHRALVEKLRHDSLFLVSAQARERCLSTTQPASPRLRAR